MSNADAAPLKEHPLSEQKLAGLEKMSRIMGVALLIGLGMMVSACLSGSFEWGFYCVLTGWIGIALGLTGGGGWAAHLLGQVPPQHRVSKGQGIFLSLFTFWIPALAAAVFGMGLVGALPDGLQPDGYEQHKMRVMFESFAMYFTAAGTTWCVVGRAVKQYIAELSSATPAKGC